MSMKRNFEQIWEQLRSQKPSRSDHLEEVRISGIRGIHDLRIPFPFPVTVLAGENGCGKSTVLFSLACAYKVPGASLREYVPSTIFPDFRPNQDHPAFKLSDPRQETAELVFHYLEKRERFSMRWKRGKSWNRSFFGKQGARQPERTVYLRTLASLTSPSDVRSVLQLANRKDLGASRIESNNIAFAQAALGFRYADLHLVTGGEKDLLIADRRPIGEASSSPRYSEFHMSAGERSMLRLSLELTELRNALVLIDEVDISLHPWVQEMLMLELQRLALRNQLQIVVTTHSPVILNTVPPEARVFLTRVDGEVKQSPTYRDIIQQSLYGRSNDQLTLLCEDEEAEALVNGVLDAALPELELNHNHLRIGRDTGKDEYPRYLEALGKFRKLSGFLFILDGDGEETGNILESRAEKMGQNAHWLLLPGEASPEVWTWGLLGRKKEIYSRELGFSGAHALSVEMDRIDQMYGHATDKPGDIAKNKLTTLANLSGRKVPDILRRIGRIEANDGELSPFRIELSEHIRRWRSLEE
ncbi:MAG: AAA family ATPase [Magnetococcales bacterium]|nr:AAA family ATPase [Magnetococcales bacterium]